MFQSSPGFGGERRAFAAGDAVLAAAPTGEALPLDFSFAGHAYWRLDSLTRAALTASPRAPVSRPETVHVEADETAERLRSLYIRHLDRPCVAEITIARTAADICGALKLVHDVYVAEGYMDPHPLGMRVLLPYHALPSTAILVARVKGTVVATMSVLFDSEAYLPIDELYPEFVSNLRGQGRKLAECGNLAIAEPFRRGPVVMHLMRATLRLAIQQGAQDLLAAVNPKHDSFYRHVWMMQRTGDQRSYSAVNGAAAVAIHADIEASIQLMRFFYGDLPRDRNLYLFTFDPPIEPPE